MLVTVFELQEMSSKSTCSEPVEISISRSNNNHYLLASMLSLVGVLTRLDLLPKTSATAAAH